MPIDVAKVNAIDVHVHAEVSREGGDPMPTQFREAAAKYFGSHGETPTADEVATYYREQNMAAVVFTVDMELRAAVPPSAMCAFISIMAPAMNPDERANMVGGMKAGAPPEIFELFRATVAAALSDAQYQALAARLGLDA